MDRKIIWLGLFVGSTVGGFVPGLWGDSSLSFAAVGTSAIGGILGIWLGYKLTR